MSELIETTRLRADLDELRYICELPRFYLAQFFAHLKENVDIEMTSKQFVYQQNKEKKESVKQIWLQMIEQIGSFEKKCIKKKYNMTTHQERLNELLAMLDKNEEASVNNLERIKEAIEKEEYQMLRELFLNQTMTLSDVTHHNDKPDVKQLLDRKLVVLANDFIRPKTIKQTYSLHFYSFLKHLDDTN